MRRKVAVAERPGYAYMFTSAAGIIRSSRDHVVRVGIFLRVI